MGNMTRKYLHTSLGLLFVLGLCLPDGLLADISLTLRNSIHDNNAKGVYLPPPVQELPISEEYYKIEEAPQHSSPGRSEVFQESNYGDAKYHIFEVHNHYEPPHQNGPAGRHQQEQEILVQHINEATQSNDDIDVSYLTFATSDNAAGAQQVAFGNLKPQTLTIETPLPTPAALVAARPTSPPSTKAVPVPVPFPSNYKHDFSRKPEVIEEYLPPIKEPQQQSQQQQQQQIVDARHSTFKGIDYLPPYVKGAHQQRQYQSEGSQAAPQNVHQSAAFKGPDYLPPFKDLKRSTAPEQTPSNVYKGPDYLPPYKNSQKSLEPSQPTNVYNVPLQSSLPQQLPQPTQPTYQNYIQQTQPQQNLFPVASPVDAGQSVFKGPDYLPPFQNTPSYKGPDYLPPFEDPTIAPLPPATEQYRAPDYLPPYFSAPSGQQQSLNAFQPSYQSQQQQQHHQQQEHQQQQQTQVQDLPGQLPPGYDFIRPDNAEAAIAELHTLPDDDGPQQLSQQQQPQYRHYAQSVAGGAQQQVNPFSSPLPTAATLLDSQQRSQGATAIVQPTVPAFRAPDYLPPLKSVSSASGTTAQAGHQHLHSLSSFMTSVEPHQQRYGNVQYTNEPRRPFLEYGPPRSSSAVSGDQQSFRSSSSQETQSFVQQSNEISPMYREQISAAGPQSYAPAMSYSSNAAAAQAYATYTTAAKQRQPAQPQQHLSQQQQHHHQHQHPEQQQQPFHQHQHHNAQSQSPSSAQFSPEIKHSLQQLMPGNDEPKTLGSYQGTQANAQASAAAALPTAQSAGAKIRTVQIINPHSVRTIRVLETADNAGVKTIQILGPSNDNPMGAHRVIKVVTQNGQYGSAEEVQTVKIFHDEVPQSLIAGGNGYLPPTTTATVKSRARVARQLSIEMPSIIRSLIASGRPQRQRWRK